MSKKTVALFSLFVAVLVALTACGKSAYGLVIRDEKGMEHIIMTDANGVTVVDDNRNLVEVITDSANKRPIKAPKVDGTYSDKQNGEYQTQSITFPGIVDANGVVEDKNFTMVLPDGWTQIGTDRLILHHDATDAQVSIYYDVSDSVEAAVTEIEDGLERLETEIKHSKSEATIDGYPATCIHTEFSGVSRDTYIFMTMDEAVCKVTCTAETTKYATCGFDTVLSAIRVK